MYEDSHLDSSYEDRTDLGFDEFDNDCGADVSEYDDEPEQDEDDGQPSEKYSKK